MWHTVASFVVHICCCALHRTGVRSECSVVFKAGILVFSVVIDGDWRGVLGVSVVGVLRVACYCSVAGCHAALFTVAVHVWCVW